MMLSMAGGVGKPKSPTLQERLLHSQRGARSNASSTATGSTNSSPATSGHSNGTVDGCGANVGSGACSHTGTWTEEDKAALLAIVQEVRQKKLRSHPAFTHILCIAQIHFEWSQAMKAFTDPALGNTLSTRVLPTP